MVFRSEFKKFRFLIRQFLSSRTNGEFVAIRSMECVASSKIVPSFFRCVQQRKTFYCLLSLQRSMGKETPVLTRKFSGSFHGLLPDQSGIFLFQFLMTKSTMSAVSSVQNGLVQFSHYINMNISFVLYLQLSCNFINRNTAK